MKAAFSTEALRKKLTTESLGAAGIWLHIPSATSAEFLAHTGCDFLIVDLQHSVTGLEVAFEMIRVVSLMEVPVLVRLTGLDVRQAGRVLDAGASGVICPMINSKQEAEELVLACRYPPRGTRSLGPFRPRILWKDSYLEEATDGVVVIAMIETPDGLNNVDDIANVDGLDGLFAGPNDVALALGEKPAMDPENRAVRKALMSIASSASRHGKFAGIACDQPEFAKISAAWGYRFHVISSDVKFMERGVQNMVSELREKA